MFFFSYGTRISGSFGWSMMARFVNGLVLTAFYSYCLIAMLLPIWHMDGWLSKEVILLTNSLYFYSFCFAQICFGWYLDRYSINFSYPMTFMGLVVLMLSYAVSDTALIALRIAQAIFASTALIGLIHWISEHVEPINYVKVLAWCHVGVIGLIVLMSEQIPYILQVLDWRLTWSSWGLVGLMLAVVYQYDASKSIIRSSSTHQMTQIIPVLMIMVVLHTSWNMFGHCWGLGQNQIMQLILLDAQYPFYIGLIAGLILVGYLAQYIHAYGLCLLMSSIGLVSAWGLLNHLFLPVLQTKLCLLGIGFSASVIIVGYAFIMRQVKHHLGLVIGITNTLLLFSSSSMLKVSHKLHYFTQIGRVTNDQYEVATLLLAMFLALVMSCCLYLIGEKHEV
ncbi:MFS transporter [Gammaproteobacteria bacterium]|nr:MFS transporter [Gammaproteobacteria bacterium]